MSQFVESLKRLYNKDKIGKAKIIQLCDEGKITDIERDYILSK